jgi:hypothetical protein
MPEYHAGLGRAHWVELILATSIQSLAIQRISREGLSRWTPRIAITILVTIRSAENVG